MYLHMFQSKPFYCNTNDVFAVQKHLRIAVRKTSSNIAEKCQKWFANIDVLYLVPILQTSVKAQTYIFFDKLTPELSTYVYCCDNICILT